MQTEWVSKSDPEGARLEHAVVDIEFILLLCGIWLPKYSVVIALRVTSIVVQNIIRLLIFHLIKDSM
jgi:hypothetical protein